MFKKFALLFTGLMLSVSSVGCCCFGGGGWGSAYRPYGCPPCNNSCQPMGGGGYVAPTAYAPQGAQIYSGDMSQAAIYNGGFTQSAYVTPSSSAYYGTSTTALAPIQGTPINVTASNSLQTYPY